MQSQIAAFVADRWRVPQGDVRVTLRPLLGGLESAVTRVRVRAKRNPAAVPRHMVVKELRGESRREADVYQLLWTHLDPPPAARLLGVEAAGDAQYLYLEHVQTASPWPWSDMRATAAVCRAMARLHDAPAFGSVILDWDYEAALARSAQETLALAGSAATSDGVRPWTRLGDLKRVVAALPLIRAQLMESGRTLIHGDVHPGNVIVSPQNGAMRVTLIDWGRARLGSPLEDVGSWLHSLGCWEPEARRRHDTLLRVYLEHRRMPVPITAALRRQYWLACVSNGLAGAIRYHVAVVCDSASDDQMRSASQQALREWERVVRRGAALISASPAPQN